MKIEYYDKLNWGAILFDLAIIGSVVILKNYWLLLLLLLSGDYKIPKYEYE